MSESGDDQQAEEQPLLDPLAGLEQSRYLSRILRSFLVVVLLLPFVALAGTLGALLLLPLVLVAGFALRDAIRLRRSVQRYGDARGR